MTTSRAIVTLMIFVVVAAAMLTAREEPLRVDVEAQHALPATMGIESDTPRPFAATKAVAAKAPAVTQPDPPAASPEPPATSMVRAIEPQREPEAEEKPAAVENVGPVTITGCLERDDAEFRLTDATGADAPTARSWKSGFLKKRPSHVEIADAVGTLNLRTLTGRRVAATGTLIDRELRARTLRLVGSCD